MGIWRFVGAFAVVERQGECGSKIAEIHVSQPITIVCVLGATILFLVSSISIYYYARISLK